MNKTISKTCECGSPATKKTKKILGGVKYQCSQCFNDMITFRKGK